MSTVQSRSARGITQPRAYIFDHPCTVWTNMQLEWSVTEAAYEAARIRARLDLAIVGLGDQTDKVGKGRKVPYKNL